MTEDEAHTKRCCGPPAVAHATYWKGGAAVEDTPALCIASTCMAWRWKPAVNRAGEPSGHHKGHCGLAGPPGA